MSEPRDVKIKRLHMRSIRRGIKEMDLILTEFSVSHLADLSDAELELYDALLAENDHDLYKWVSSGEGAPEAYAPIWDRLVAGAQGLTRAN